MYTIGQFSLITRLSVRTLRKYHEMGLLLPDYTDDETGYRYYKESSIERAQIITGLRELEFPLKDIKSILESCSEDEDILDQLIQQRDRISQQLTQIQEVEKGLQLVIQQAQKRQRLPEDSEPIQIKEVPELFVAGIRATGPWNEIGGAFKPLGRKAGRYIKPPALSLCFDGEYKEEAHYEAAFALKKEIHIDGLECHKLPAIRCVAVIHKGPYSEIGMSYERALGYVADNKLDWQIPTREIYHKGPGMIFKGNPEKYITEIQIPVL